MRGGLQRGDPLRTAGVAIFVAAFSLILGFLAVEQSATVFPLTLETLGLAGLTWYFVVHMRDTPAAKRWLGRVVLAALAIRLLLAVVIHFRLSGTMFAPDAEAYQYFGRTLSRYWLGDLDDPGSIFANWESLYYRINGVFFYLFGPSPLGPVVLNMFISLWTAILAFRMGRELVDERTAKILTLLVAFFPSLILWSVLNIRDSISTFLIVFIAYTLMKLSARVRPKELLLLGVAFLLLSMIRDYAAVLVGAGAVTGAVASVRRGKVLQTFIIASIATIVVVYGFQGLGLLERSSDQDPFALIAEMRSGMMIGAESTFGEELDPSTPMGALVALPVGLVYLLFAPFPWAITSVLQLLTLPEVLLWYALVPFTLIGAFRAGSMSAGRILIPTGILLLLLIPYALVEGNIGTAYRHRAQMMPLLFIFTAIGIEHFLRGRKRAGERRRSRRRRARAGSGGGAPGA